jgi:hypothetical protein
MTSLSNEDEGRNMSKYSFADAGMPPYLYGYCYRYSFDTSMDKAAWLMPYRYGLMAIAIAK